MAQERLAAIGTWMKQKALGIYGSKPWKIQGERLDNIKNLRGKISLTDEEKAMKDNEYDATSKSIFPEVRFTHKDDAVFAYVCSANDNSVLIKSLSTEKQPKIKSVIRLDNSGKVVWKQTKEGLIIEIPKYLENEIPITGFKIELK